MFNPTMPLDGTTGDVLFGQIFENDKLNRALNDAAVLITGLTRGKIVAWSATNSRWELYDGTVAPEPTTIIGIVEYVGSPDTSGGVRVTGVYLDDTLADNTAYYCQSNGTLGATETATFIGICTNAGRLVMQGRGSGGSSSGASIGTGNYIAEPFSVVPGTGLEVLVNPNRCVIDETAVESASQTAVALTAKAAQLVFKKKDGTYDKLLPKMAAADLVDANTVGLWFPDGSASVPNAAVGVNGNTLAVTNALTKSGTITAVDGWAGGDAGKGDGSTGYYTSANSTGFSAGGSVTEISMLYTHATESSIKEIIRCDNFVYDISVTSSQELNITNNSGGSVLTGFIFEAGKTYPVVKQYNGTSDLIFISGQLVFTYSVARSQAAAVIKPFGISGYLINGVLHFVQIRNALRTPAQIAAEAQKLLIPCQYGTTDIRDALANKAESQIVAFVTASATVPTTIIAPDDPKGATPERAYGMPIGPSGIKNKIKFLGWQYFGSTPTQLYWANPFDTRKVKTSFVWAEDANGRNESELYPDGNYANIGYGQSPSRRISLYVASSGALYFSGVAKTSGYIGAYAEVID